MSDQLKINYEKIYAKLVEKLYGKEAVENAIKQRLDELGAFITREAAIHLIAEEQGIECFPEAKPADDPTQLPMTEIASIKEDDIGTWGHNFVGVIVSVGEKKTYNTVTYIPTTFSDKTGFIKLTLWGDDKDHAELVGKPIIIENAKIDKTKFGDLQLKFGRRTFVHPLVRRTEQERLP